MTSEESETMGRPHRPNPYEGQRDRTQWVDPAKRPWRATHVKQETAKERRERKRREAEERQAESERRRQAEAAE